MSRLKIYKASAGSGKTYTIALEYIRELLIRETPANFRHILAVTFTNDATGEMKQRILAELYGLAFDTPDSRGFMHSLQEALKRDGKATDTPAIRQKALEALRMILHDYSRLSITTIDSFFQKVLRNLARELGRGSRFNLEMNSAKIRSDAVGAIISKANKDQKLLGWLTTYVQTKLENDGNWRFRNEVFEFSSCIYNEFFQEHESLLREQLEATPDLFGRLREDHSRIMRESRTRLQEICREVLSLLEENGLEPGDFIRGTVIRFWQKLAENPAERITLNTASYLEDAGNWVTKSHKQRGRIISLIDSQLMSLFRETLEEHRRFTTSKLIAGNIHQLGLVWYITNEIDAMNAENNRFMLSDTALFLNRMIDGSDAPFIFEKIGSEIRHVMIDEFQDTSRLQWHNFKSLLTDILANNRFSMVVGDVKQSIYRWRNGDWRILNGISGELSVGTETLGYNYRSEKRIIGFNNRFFTDAGRILDTKFEEEIPGMGDSPFRSAYSEGEVSQKTHRRDERGYILARFPGRAGESDYKEVVAATLTDELERLRSSGIPAEKICILTRTNGEIQFLADYFSSRKGDYPDLERGNYLNIVSSEAFRLDSSLSVRIIMEALKSIANPESLICRAQLDYFLRSAGLENRFEESARLTEMPLFELVTYLYACLGLNRIEGQSPYLFFFYDALNRFLQDNQADLYSFVRFWEEELKARTIAVGEGIEGVRAMTVHRSKGLQFHTVLIPFCNWDLNPKFSPVVWCGKKEGVYDLELLPVTYSSGMNDTVFSPEYRQETALSWLDNLNLLYVAFTRAEENLILYGKYKKSLKGPGDVKTVSDLLQLIVPEMDGVYDPENFFFEAGNLLPVEARVEEESENPLKQNPPALPVSFFAEGFRKGKPVFRQSNRSRDFISRDSSSKEQYVAHGNIMHALFAGINIISDIPRAVHRLVADGLLLPGEKEAYIRKAEELIRNSGRPEWFDGTYRSYPEFSILLEEGGEITTRRPDRILTGDRSTLVIDYKFGEPRASYREQVREYVSLLKRMNCPQPAGYLWYVEKGIIEEV